jgi:hypothetical protein
VRAIRERLEQEWLEGLAGEAMRRAAEQSPIPLALHRTVFERHMPKLPGGKAASDAAIAAAAAANQGRRLAVSALAAWRDIMSDETSTMVGRPVRAKRTAMRLIEGIGRKLDPQWSESLPRFCGPIEGAKKWSFVFRPHRCTE